MRQVLAAIDDSEQARRAARMAADLSIQFGARLMLVHVIPPLLYPLESFGIDVAELDKADRLVAEALLRRAEKALEAPGLEVERRALWGSPAETIAELAEAPDLDLVVVGSRGRNAAARVLLGATSDRLVHICPKPVLVVR